MTNQHEPNGSPLTPIQQQRYDYLFPIYGELSSTIVQNVFGKGKTSWNSSLEKIDLVMEAKPKIKEYYNGLYETFDLYQVYTSGQIIGKVNEARREMGLIPYTEKIKIQSEADFNLVFFVRDHYDDVVVEGVPAKVFKGYQPVAKVLPA